MSDLRRTMVKGGIWFALVRVVLRLTGVAKNVVLARFLAPDDIGLIGIAFLAISLAERVTKVSMDHALLAQRQAMMAYANSAWTIGVLRGALITGLLWLVAEPLVALLGDDTAAPLLRAVALIPLIQGFRNPLLAKIRYELNYRLIALFEIGALASQHFGVIVAVILYPSVWGLATGLIIGESVALVLSYVVLPYWPRVERRWSHLRELLIFGQWMTLTSIIMIWNLDSWFVSILLGTTALGYFEMARRFSLGILTDLTALVQGLVMPAYANHAEEPETLQKLVLKALQFIAVVSFPLIAAIQLLGEPLFHWVLGEAWLPAVGVFKLLALVGLVVCLTATGGPLFYALGQPKRDFRMNISRALVHPVALWFFMAWWGMEGAAMATILAAITVLPFWFGHLRALTGVTLRAVVGVLVTPALITALVVGATAGLTRVVPPDDLWATLTLGLTYGLGYLALLVAWWRLRDDGPIAWVMRR